MKGDGGLFVVTWQDRPSVLQGACFHFDVGHCNQAFDYLHSLREGESIIGDCKIAIEILFQL